MNAPKPAPRLTAAPSADGHNLTLKGPDGATVAVVAVTWARYGHALHGDPEARFGSEHRAIRDWLVACVNETGKAA